MYVDLSIIYLSTSDSSSIYLPPTNSFSMSLSMQLPLISVSITYFLADVLHLLIIYHLRVDFSVGLSVI